MKPSDSSQSRVQDDRLADFADRLVAGEAKQVDPNIDDELRGLEQTALRLQQAFPKTSLEPAQIQQMQARLNSRLKRQQVARPETRWKWPIRNWQSQRVRQRTALVFVGLAALASLIILPILQEENPDVVGTAGLNSPMIIAALALLGAVALGLWLSRKK